MILSTIRKVQAIANALSGRDIGVAPDDLGEPWHEYYLWIQKWIEEDPQTVDRAQLHLEFMQYCHFNGDEHKHNYNLIAFAQKNPIAYKPIEDILDDLPEFEWLWPNWIPRGMLTIFASQQGTGKSYVALDIAHRIINGSQFPDGAPVPPGDHCVLYLDAENSPAIYKQRVSTWTPVERRNLYYMRANPEQFIFNLDDETDRDQFLDLICVVHPTLVIVDSYGSASLRGENKKEDVQDLLIFLTKVAIDHHLGMLLVHHLRKSASGVQEMPLVTLDSVKGSGFITQLARNVIGMQFSYHAEKNGPRRLWIVKTNTGEAPDPLGVSFRPHPENPAVAQIEYGKPPETQEETSKTEECETWLLELLRDASEPVRPKDIFEIGELEGFSARMIHRARKRLSAKIVDTNWRFNPENCWKLATESEEKTSQNLNHDNHDNPVNPVNAPSS